MGRNNICVIYDSDENYAKRLMSVINDDNDIPYNAQVFTKEHELDKYLQEKEADMLMICEGAYGYNAYRTGNKTVVLCEEEREADEINSREEKGLVGICKYQPSYQLLQSVMRYEKKDRVQKRGSLKVTGVYGFNNTARMMLSLAVARLMSEHGNTLFINFETFYGFKGILKGEENENLSDALYAFRQNHNQFHKNIVNAISHYERLDYIPDASCAEDIDDIKPEEMGTFIQAIGRELGYSNIVIDIGDGMEDVKSICVNISEMVRIAEDYMLDIDHVKIEPRFIYMDVGTKKLQFVYHTKVNGYSFNESLKILFEFILEHFDHSLDKESIVQLYEVYQKVIVGDYDPFNLMRLFGIKKVKKQEESVIQDMPEKRDKEIKTVIAEQMISDKEEKADESDVNIRRVIIGVVSMAFGLLSIFVPGLIPFRIPSVLSFVCIGAGIGILVFCKKEHKKLQSVILTQKQSIPYVMKKDTAQVLHNESVNVNNKCIEEKTVSYDDICNETMLLSEYMPEKNSRKELKLVLQKENLIGEVLIYIRGVENEDSIICMDKYPYVIGSFEKMSDVVIKAQVVSRMHCCIYHEAFKDDEYLVEDLNATNGTYLNGERLGNHERKKLSDGDVLKIAAISFKVEIS